MVCVYTEDCMVNMACTLKTIYMLTNSTRCQAVVAYHVKFQLPQLDTALHELSAVPLRVNPESLYPLGLSPACMQRVKPIAYVLVIAMRCKLRYSFRQHP